MQLLLVEDAPDDRVLAHRGLQGLDATIQDATTLKQARTLLETERFDCVILDWSLEGNDAIELLESIRRDHPDLPVVVMAATNDAGLAEQVLQAGAQDILVKDPGRFDLSRAVRFAIERQHATAMQARLAHADRLVSVGRLAAGIAHEVNNPATVVMSNLSMLQELIEQPTNPALAAELVSECRTSILRIGTMMTQLVAFSRRRGGGVVELAMHELVEEGVRLARPSMRHRATLRIEPALVPPIVVDRVAMVGVIVNLLVNAQQAIDAAVPGPHEVLVRLSATDDHIELVVEDSGIGVAVSERERIFEAFVTRREHGLGLGLAICREVVRSHGGTIRVEDSSLGGAAFIVTLPHHTGLTPTATPDLPDWTKPLDVLVIDDEPSVRRAISRLLREHRVIEAHSVAEARRHLEEGNVPDVIVCDLMLDGELGSVLYESLREVDPDLANRILFVTGGAVTPDAGAFLRKIEPPLLTKPFNATELRVGIQQLLTRAVTQSALPP
ncbi:MAG: response regulator [Myxococcota bacterium]